MMSKTIKKSPYVVVGLGKTGWSCLEYFTRQGIPCAVVDSRQHPPDFDKFRQCYPDIPYHIGSLECDFLQHAQEIIISPGMALDHPALQACRARGISLIGDIELFARVARAPIVAITGTNGKSTVTALLGEMAKQAAYQVGVGGNIGEPVLNFLREPPHDLYILELSSFQLESVVSLRPKVASILNISPDHLDRYASYADYVAAKHRVYQHAEYAVCNLDDSQTFPRDALPYDTYSLQTPSQRAPWGIRWRDQRAYISYQDTYLLSVDDLRLSGQQNWRNVLAAFALAQGIGLPMEAMITAARNFAGLVHRCQWLGCWQGVDWYNDSKSTNVGACVAALKGLGPREQGQLILIAGGQGKGGDFTLLRPWVEQYVRTVIVMGEDADLITHALEGTVVLQHASDMNEAVTLAKKAAQYKDVVLLSPACASFDGFDNFMHRGEVFMECVKIKH